MDFSGDLAMIEFNVKDVKQYESDLKTFAGRAYPFATKSTINQAAFEARLAGQENLRNNLTLRNKFTERSVQVEKARTLNVRNQAAIVGGTVDYLETQEFGGTASGKTGNQPIATGYSAGQEGDQPRTRLPRKAHKMRSIQLRHKARKAVSRKQRNLIVVRQAAKGGDKFVFLDLGRRQGIFRVLGGVRRTRVKMVWDLSRKTVRIPRNPWLEPATRKVETQIPALYAQALAFQLDRFGLFR